MPLSPWNIRTRLALLTLNRPDKMNTFSSQLAQELNEGLRRLDQDDQVQIVIVKGAGRAFSTGIDIAEFPGKSTSEYQAWISGMDEMHLTIAGMAKPVIAQVHGFAVANGAGLLFAADFAIVAEGTKIGTTAIKVGLLCTGPIIPISYSLGKKKVLEMLLSGDMIDAAEAESLGLVNRVVPLDKSGSRNSGLCPKDYQPQPPGSKIGQAILLSDAGYALQPEVHLQQRSLRPAVHLGRCQRRGGRLSGEAPPGLAGQIIF